MTPETARLVLLGFGLLLLCETPVKSCASMEDQPLYRFSPTLEINTLEYPNENVQPTGYNITIICTSNFSKANWGYHYYSQPYWIQQFFNDDFIGYCGGRDGRVDSEDSKVCTYVIQNSTQRDSGNYSCVSRNQMDCTHGTISLKFEGPSTPKFTLTSPHHINASAGSIVNLTCEATGIPRPVIKWYKDWRPVPMEYISEVNRISLLTLESVRPDDQGEYWCEAQNAEGWTKSSRTSLNLLSKPTILVHPENVSVYLEDKPITVIFTCLASGFPPPVISWVKNDSPVSSGNVIQNGSTSSLVLRLLKGKETPGVYKCIAKNSVGEASSKEGALVICAQTHSIDDKSTSSRVSKALWISIATGSGFLFVMGISICLVRNMCKKANYNIGKEINEERRFPHLQINEGAMGQIRDSHTQRYQMMNMGNET